MPGQEVHENLRAEFDEEALGQEEGESPADLKIQLDQLFKNGKEVSVHLLHYQSYLRLTKCVADVSHANIINSGAVVY